MPEYFMSNNVAQFDLSSSSVTGVTTGGTFDAAVVDSSILLPAAPAGGTSFSAGAPILVGGPSLTTKVFGRFDMIGTATSAQSLAGTYFFLRIRNSTGQSVFELSQAETGAGAQVSVQARFWNGSAFVNTGSAIRLPAFTTLNTWNFEFLPGALGTFVLYLNGGTVPFLSISGMNAAVNNCAVVDIGNPSSNTAHISQIALSDVDLRGAKIYSRRPSANGFYTAGTGTFTDVNTVAKDDLTGIGLPVVGDRKTFLLPTVTAPGRIIRNVHVNNLCAATGATPNARVVTRRVSTDSVSGNVSPAPGVGLTARQTALPVDLSTGVAWTLANFNATEFGMEGRA